MLRVEERVHLAQRSVFDLDIADKLRRADGELSIDDDLDVIAAGHATEQAQLVVERLVVILLEREDGHGPLPLGDLELGVQLFAVREQIVLRRVVAPPLNADVGEIGAVSERDDLLVKRGLFLAGLIARLGIHSGIDVLVFLFVQLPLGAAQILCGRLPLLDEGCIDGLLQFFFFNVCPFLFHCCTSK